MIDASKGYILKRRDGSFVMMVDGNATFELAEEVVALYLKTGYEVREEQSMTNGIMPLRDEIIMYTRYYNGRYQCRRWNATRNYWVDPYWIDVNP